MSVNLDLLGYRFFRLLVVSEVAMHTYPSGLKRRVFLCECDCGNKVKVKVSSLRSGNTKSCGCLNKELSSKANATHGASKHPLYSVWKDMISRCYNKRSVNYINYGGRGISVCDRWAGSPSLFFADIGDKPSSKHSIDRVDNSKGYFPENCKWSNNHEQSANTRRNARCVGVCWDSIKKTWLSYLMVDGVSVHFGRHNSWFEAVCSRKSSEARHGV